MSESIKLEHIDAILSTDMLDLLSHRFGDGLVYFYTERERECYRRAVHMGLVSAEGYLTPRGLRTLARRR